MYFYMLLLLTVSLPIAIFSADIERDPERLLKAIREGNIEECDRLLVAGWSPRHQGQFGADPIHQAAMAPCNSLKICTLLLEHDPSLVHHRRGRRYSTLFDAAYNGRCEKYQVCKLFLERGVIPTRRLASDLSYSPGCKVVGTRVNDADIMALLIKYGMPIPLKVSFGDAPVQVRLVGQEDIWTWHEGQNLLVEGHALLKRMHKMVASGKSALDCSTYNQQQKNLLLRYAVMYALPDVVSQLLAIGASPLAVAPCALSKSVHIDISMTIRLAQRLKESASDHQSVHNYEKILELMSHNIELLLDKKEILDAIIQGDHGFVHIPQDILRLLVESHSAYELVCCFAKNKS